MKRYIIKRNGKVEEFTVEKLIKWEQWALEDGDNDLRTITQEVVADLPENLTSQELQLKLINTLKERKSFSALKAAGKLYAAYMRKRIFNRFKAKTPTVKELHDFLYEKGLMLKLNYTDEEYEYIENNIIDHSRDFTYTYHSVYQLIHKYALANRKTKEIYETPQFVFMRMAMALAENEENKLQVVKDYYDLFSLNKINAPTPNYINLGTPHKGFISCCLYQVEDDVRSLAIGDHIAYTMTYMSAGIGSFLNVRSINDDVKNGLIKHQGKLPYFKSLGTAVNANLQLGRGGACTTFFMCYDPEVLDIIYLQNPRTPLQKQNRMIHFAFMFNDFFIEKVIKNEEIFLFNVYTAPDLVEAFFDKDSVRFKELYYAYEANKDFPKKYVNARQLALETLRQCHECGTLYLVNINAVNKHTSFKEKIYQSNLCLEILQPTKPYKNMMDLYTDNPHENGEISLCALAGIIAPNIEDDKEYYKACYYALKMIDYCIDNNSYVFKHLEYTAKVRRNAGAGIIGLAYELAKNNLNYTTKESKAYMHFLAERHSYFLIKASLELAKEKGLAPWIHKTKWSNGWLPIDDYNSNVDKIADFKYHYNWEELRKELKEVGGIRHSALVAHMPTESSSKATGMPNGLYPIRDIYLVKTDGSNTVDWISYEADKLKDKYQRAWDIPLKDLIEMYAIFTKFADQGISADIYIDRTKEKELKASRLLDELLYMWYYGVKTRYYTNAKTTDAEALEEIKGCSGGSCTL